MALPPYALTAFLCKSPSVFFSPFDLTTSGFFIYIPHVLPFFKYAEFGLMNVLDYTYYNGIFFKKIEPKQRSLFRFKFTSYSMEFQHVLFIQTRRWRHNHGYRY